MQLRVYRCSCACALARVEHGAEPKRILTWCFFLWVAQKEGSAAERIKSNPRGFLSMDNAKRDEFSNVTRTAQWRENLGKEIRFTQKGAAAFYKNLPEPTKEDHRMKMLMRRSMSSSSVIGA